MKNFKNYFFFFSVFTNRNMDKKEITEQDCIKWKLNKYINPHTRYKFKVKEKSKEYKRFKKACEGIKTPIKEKIIPDNVIITTQNEPITKELCYKWIANNKLINPITNSKIDKKGKLFKDITKACIILNIIDENTKEVLKEHKPFIDKYKKIINIEKITKNPKYKLKNEPTKEECKRWIKNKLINPQTNIKIKKNGEIYMALKNKCKELGINDINLRRNKNRFRIIREEIIRRDDKSSSITISSDIKPIIKEKINKIEDELTEPYYPELNDPNFNRKLLELKEINVHKINKYPDILTYKDYEKKTVELCGDFDKSSFQYLMAHYLSHRTPYKSLLLYYGVGVGKTCSAITIAESLLINHNSTDEPKIWVILPSATKEGFKSQIFNISKLADNSLITTQCTGDTYIKLSQISKETDIKTAEKKIRDLIKTRYAFFTYEEFANNIDNHIKNGKKIMDKVIIIDEAHNIRSSNSSNDKDKRVYLSLKEVCKNGINNRLIFLTATPMFNEPEDIYELFYLLLLNDKRLNLYRGGKIFDNNNKLKDEAKKFISLMSSNYISYLRGKNPFNFALKISPKLNNFEILDKIIPLKSNGEPIDEIDRNWIKNLENDLIISKLSKKQIEFINENNKVLIDDKIDDDNITTNTNFALYNSTNIVFDKYVGSKGFNTFFVKEGDKEQLTVRYSSKYKNALAPENIGLYSGKYAKIAEIIKKSRGIVIIYSRYIDNGIIPLAIMLEHMGFTREGTANILSESLITDPVNYPDIKYPKYCILSSENPIYMGNTTIDKLRMKINNPLNINGELVKVVLMTQVASEGLNFLNIREIHILDPWFHFNRIDQIIGRGIRNCSHKKLPIEERNVSVYLHCAINDYNIESLDVNAYRIATRKLYKSYIVDEIIRNNSIDCALFKNINYFPKSMFKLGPIKIITSQGKEIEYNLGDDEKYNPKCKVELDDLKENKIGFREETYKHLAINIQTKLKKIILEYIQNNRRFISYEYLKEIFDYVEPEILLHSIKISIYPNIIIDNILLLPHEDGIHIIDIIEDKPLKINIIKENIEIRRDNKNLDKNLYKKIKGIKNENYYNAIFSLYSAMDKYTFDILINKIFKFNRLNEIDDYIEELFVKEGVLIKSSEVPSITTNDKYIGFVNIFNEEFEPLIYNPDEKNHHSFNKKQIEQLISNRVLVKPPEDFTQEKYAWGLVVPISVIDDKKNKRNVFKLLTAGVIYGKKTGIVCSSLQKNEHNKILTDLGIIDTKNTKTSYCNKIAVELAKRNRLSILPEYKPK